MRAVVMYYPANGELVVDLPGLVVHQFRIVSEAQKFGKHLTHGLC